MGAKGVSKRLYEQAIKIAPNDAKLLIEYAALIGESNVQLGLNALKSAHKLLLDGKGVDIESSTYHLEALLVDQFCKAGAHNLGYDAIEGKAKRFNSLDRKRFRSTWSGKV
jgi:hypothetical protein